MPDSTESFRKLMQQGLVIPAHPLALTEDRKMDERRQRALTRYYCDAGSGGVAVGVHTTQFTIRDAGVGLYEPVLELALEEVCRFENRTGKTLAKIGGVCGDTARRVREAETLAAAGIRCRAAQPGRTQRRHQRRAHRALPHRRRNHSH